MIHNQSNPNFQLVLKMKWPLMLAPLAGGPGTSELVATVSESGGLGSLGAAYMDAKTIEETVLDIRYKTKRPFAINLFVPQVKPEITNEMIQNSLDATSPFRQELKIESPTLQAPFDEDFDDQFEAALKARPSIFSFTFGTLPKEYLSEIRHHKILAVGTATSLEEALHLQESRLDAIVLQGFEAGGHRGIFDPQAKDPEVPMLRLLEACKKKIDIPLIAAGGIMTSEHIQTALRAGASLVQMGTAFLACREAGTSNAYRKKLLETSKRQTKITRAFSGRLARGIENRFMNEMDRKPEAVLPFPAQNKLTRDLRTAASNQDNPEFISLWSGTGTGDLWTGSANELIENLFKF